MSDLAGATGAAARAVDVLLRAMGGRAVMLRLPAPAVPGDVTEQLGAAVPAFRDVPLAPVVFRKARAMLAEGKPTKYELLVSATVVEGIVGSLAFASASLLFATAYGVLVDEELLEIAAAADEQVFGEPYVFRLELLGPLAETV